MNRTTDIADAPGQVDPPVTVGGSVVWNRAERRPAVVMTPGAASVIGESLPNRGVTFRTLTIDRL